MSPASAAGVLECLRTKDAEDTAQVLLGRVALPLSLTAPPNPTPRGETWPRRAG